MGVHEMNEIITAYEMWGGFNEEHPWIVIPALVLVLMVSTIFNKLYCH